MALLEKNGEMAAMCRRIEETSTTQQLAGYLDYFLEDSSLWEELPNSKPLPTNYAKAFPYSGVVRIRRGNWDSTILSNNASFLTFHNTHTILQGMRIAASFFGKGQFQTERIEKIDDTWILKNSMEGPYYQPLNKKYIDKAGDWEKMIKSKRPQSEIQKLDYLVKIQEIEGGLEVEFQISGTDNVPVTLELIFRAGGLFSGVEKYAKRDNAYLFSEKIGTYSVGTDKILFENGRLEHKQLQLRGALPATEAPTAYLTGFTPFNHKIKLIS